MVETAFVMLFLALAFFAAFQFADTFRAKLLCEYAAARVARARTVGFNDWMLRKTANLATMSAAGECLTDAPSGGAPSAAFLVSRMADYLDCGYDAQAEKVLDFEYWHDGRTAAVCPLYGAKLTAAVTQRRPVFFNLAAAFGGAPQPDDGDDAADSRVTGHASIEAHYPAWMQ